MVPFQCHLLLCVISGTFILSQGSSSSIRKGTSRPGNAGGKESQETVALGRLHYDVCHVHRFLYRSERRVALPTVSKCVWERERERLIPLITHPSPSQRPLLLFLHQIFILLWMSGSLRPDTHPSVAPDHHRKCHHLRFLQHS